MCSIPGFHRLYGRVVEGLGAASRINSDANVLTIGGGVSGTITLSGLSGVGSTRFGSNATINGGGVSQGVVDVAGLLRADISGGTVVADGAVLELQGGITDW